VPRDVFCIFTVSKFEYIERCLLPMMLWNDGPFDLSPYFLFFVAIFIYFLCPL